MKGRGDELRGMPDKRGGVDRGGAQAHVQRPWDSVWEGV